MDLKGVGMSELHPPVVCRVDQKWNYNTQYKQEVVTRFKNIFLDASFIEPNA